MNHFNRSFMRVKCIALINCLLILLSSCSKSPYDGMREGKVVYDLEIQNQDVPMLLDAMMPSEATVWFSEGKSCLVMEGIAGAMKIRVISDPYRRVYASLVSIAGQKGGVLSNPDSVEASRMDKKEHKLEFTGKTKTIAGLECREVVVRDTAGNVFNVFFTNELDVQTPNWGMAFAEIDGLLMEYDFEIDNMRMHLKAKKVTADKPDPDLFLIPSDYELTREP